MHKTSERALRSGCKYCGSGSAPEYSPNKWYWWTRGDSNGPFVLADVFGNVHDCPKRKGTGRFDGPATAPEASQDGSEDDAEVTAEVNPMDAIKAAMEQAMADQLAKLGIPAGSATVTATSPKGGKSKINRRTGKWDLLAATADKLPLVILTGPPGTGKTHIAMAAGVTDPDKVDRVNITEDTPAAEVRGHYIPKGGGEFAWHDGPGMRRFRNGGRLVLDEITRGTDDCLSFLLGLLDGHAITLPSGERVERHPEFSCWATTNDGPEALTDALADRLVVRIECNEVNPEALATLPPNLAKVVTAGDDGGVTLREVKEYHRLTSDPAFMAISNASGRDLAAEFVWGPRAKDVSKAIEMGTKLT